MVKNIYLITECAEYQQLRAELRVLNGRIKPWLKWVVGIIVGAQVKWVGKRYGRVGLNYRSGWMRLFFLEKSI